VPKNESFALWAGVSDRLHDVVKSPYGFGWRGASKGVFGSDFPGAPPGVGIGPVPHVTVFFAFPDGMGLEQDSDCPAPQRPERLARRGLGPRRLCVWHGGFLKHLESLADSHVPRSAAKLEWRFPPAFHRKSDSTFVLHMF
jgi:hypothetical protein